VNAASKWRERGTGRGIYVAAAILLRLVLQTAQAAEPGGLSPDHNAHNQTVPDQLLCQAAIATVERSSGLPPQLLRTIGLVESGRPDPGTGRAVSWPWTINVAGTGYFFPTRFDAIAAVERFRATGVLSIDVGCLQVNLMHHPAAFDSLDQAFNPQANVKYAATFLTALYRETGTWPRATAAYHSRTPDLGHEYARRVMTSWPLAGRYGVLPEPGRAGGALADLKVYTPEFAARLRSAAADRAARIAAMRGPPLRRHIAGAGLVRQRTALLDR
jgi:hypothetical protein